MFCNSNGVVTTCCDYCLPDRVLQCINFKSQTSDLIEVRENTVAEVHVAKRRENRSNNE